MVKAKFQELNRLLDVYLGLEPDQRANFFEDLNRRDEAVADELRELIALAGEDTAELAASALAEPPPHADELQPGSMLGAYRVLGELGRGGMGVVYLAERADGQFQRRAAIKVLVDQAAGSVNLARFHRERQVLAGLNHPNIAQLLDSGVAPGGAPYFVLEYVDGQSIDAYCNARRLSVRQRLRLFQTVCEAVRFAHRHLVIHRDLKPGNILVTEDGQVKLDDRPVHEYTLSNDIGYIEPKARVY